jgi:undecaprenyl-diphosphatase
VSPARNLPPHGTGEPASGFRFGLELLIAAVVAVVVLGQLASNLPGWTRWELGILQQVSRLHSGFADAAALGVNWLFSPAIAGIVLVLVAVATLLVTRSARSATQLVVLTGLAWLGSALIKTLVHRPRPDIASLSHILIAHPGGFSFPSGHTSFASALAMSLILVSRDWRTRRPVLVVAVGVAILTGLSRVYLGVHYPTDVVGSWAYACAAVLLLDRLWRRFVLPRWTGRRLW